MATEKADKNIYICPTYCVPTRRPYFVFAAQLRTKAPADKWVLAGVAWLGKTWVKLGSFSAFFGNEWRNLLSSYLLFWGHLHQCAI
jgi:hypothetical protein